MKCRPALSISIMATLLLLATVTAACSSAAATAPSTAAVNRTSATTPPPPTTARTTRPTTVPTTVPSPTTAGPRDASTPPTGATAEDPQVGLNFIRFFWTDGKGLGPAGPVQAWTEPNAIFADFASLGVQVYRQLVKADLLWDVVEPHPGEWHFENADAVLRDPRFEPIVTLFSMQYASPTPPWADSPSEFQKTLGPEAREYLETVVRRYAPYVTYWELGNEMEHWRIADPGNDKVPGNRRLPGVMPSGGFSPEEQGAFLAEASAIIRGLDPDAVIVLPGMGGLGDNSLDSWLPGVIAGGGGSDWFDVVNYHYYSSWATYVPARRELSATIDRLGLGDKPVWMTESGSTASPTLTQRTDYPNDQRSQAADVFRRLVQSWGRGDSMALWHTYIGSSDTPDNDWRLYGISTDAGMPQPSYYAFRLLVQELVPFERVEPLATGGQAGANVYRVVTRAGEVRYVAWGAGSFTVPEGVSRMTSVVPPDGGAYQWQPVRAGRAVALAQEPLLME